MAGDGANRSGAGDGVYSTEFPDAPTYRGIFCFTRSDGVVVCDGEPAWHPQRLSDRRAHSGAAAVPGEPVLRDDEDAAVPARGNA